MQVFRSYFKILRSNRVAILWNLGVFMVLAVFFSTTAPETNEDMFEPTRTRIAVINRDPGGVLAEGLEKHLEQVGQRVFLNDDEEELQDALFYRRVQYIAIIPEGFSQDFMEGNEGKVETVVIPNSTMSYYMDMSVDAFLNTARLHNVHGRSHTQTDLVRLVLSDLDTHTRVVMKQSGVSTDSEPNYQYFFNYCAYALLAMIVSGISSTMIAFNRPDLYMRNRCAPIPQRKVSLQILAGHGIFALACWSLLMILAMLLYGRSLSGSGLTLLYFGNTLAFTMVCLSIGFLLGDIIKNHNAQTGAVQVITLGLNFLGGVFVPQEVMSQSVLAVARFLPSFWFVQGNELITSLSDFSKASIMPVYTSILTQAGFAIAIAAVALLLRKERRMSQFA